MLHHADRQRGFTLVEVMISLAIFLIASVGLLPLLLGNLQANRRNLQHGQAQRLAAEAMAVLQGCDVSALEVLGTGAEQHGGVAVVRAVEIGAPAAGQARLTVTALWEHRQQRCRYQLESIRSLP